MNKLRKAEKYVRRTELAKLIGTNVTYLSVLAREKNLSPLMEARLKTALAKIIRELKKVVER